MFVSLVFPSCCPNESFLHICGLTASPPSPTTEVLLSHCCCFHSWDFAYSVPKQEQRKLVLMAASHLWISMHRTRQSQFCPELFLSTRLSNKHVFFFLQESARILKLNLEMFVCPLLQCFALKHVKTHLFPPLFFFASFIELLFSPGIYTGDRRKRQKVIRDDKVCIF